MHPSELSSDDRRDYDRLPPALRELLDAEIAAGNRIAAVEHGFPAAPIGASFKLTGPVRTHPRSSRGEISFYERNTPQYGGEFTVEPRHFFILEPPVPEPEVAVPAPPPTPPTLPALSPLLQQFTASMTIDYEKWREGEGYALELLPRMTEAERRIVERDLIQRLDRHGDWRDLEALAAMNTRSAEAAIDAARSHPDREVRAYAVQRVIENGNLPEELVEASVIRVVEEAASMSTLSRALHLAASCSTTEVRRAVLERARTGDSTTRVHMAALLYYLCGKSEEPFDWNHRPFFLRFGDHNDQTDFRAAWQELRSLREAFEAARGAR